MVSARATNILISEYDTSDTPKPSMKLLSILMTSNGRRWR